MKWYAKRIPMAEATVTQVWPKGTWKYSQPDEITGKRHRIPLTDTEIAERAAREREREAAAATVATAAEELSAPAGDIHVEGDPPTRPEHLITEGKIARLLAEIPRGEGAPEGSTLVIAEKAIMDRQTGLETRFIAVYMRYLSRRERPAIPVRSLGVALREQELPAVIDALEKALGGQP